MWEIQYTHFSIVPGIAVAVSIMVFGFGEDGSYSGVQGTQKVFPLKYPIIQSSPSQLDWLE